MRKHSVGVLTVVVGAVLWIAGRAQAQYAPHQVKVNIPFEFMFREKLFPPGDYVMACTPISIELRNPRGEVVATGVSHSVESRGLVPAKLVFVSGAGYHVLSQIWPGATRYGYEFAPSKPAELMAKQRSQKPGEGVGGANK